SKIGQEQGVVLWKARTPGSKLDDKGEQCAYRAAFDVSDDP
ncbi:hypothetical protein, partial, partial [Parasitella parasitica]